MKAFNIIVLAKQVPDTRNVGKDAMKADGTINRATLPAIFNPEDLNALEQALRIKDKIKNTHITLLTMGPSRAAEIIREGFYRGADDGILLTDRAFAGADTLATSYTLACAIRKIKDFNLIFSGRQAIDGDTAQVGPQVAEKLSVPQITYVEEVIDINKNKIVAKRRLENGIEIVEASLPLIVTVNSSAPCCRPRNAKLLMQYKHSKTLSEQQNISEDYIMMHPNRSYLTIKEWSINDINCDFLQLGLKGSPTKVKAIENVVFTVKDVKRIGSKDEEIEALMIELINNHTIG